MSSMASSSSRDLEDMTFHQMRTECKNLGLPACGGTIDLKERLREHLEGSGQPAALDRRGNTTANQVSSDSDDNNRNTSRKRDRVDGTTLAVSKRGGSRDADIGKETNRMPGDNLERRGNIAGAKTGGGSDSNVEKESVKSPPTDAAAAAARGAMLTVVKQCGLSLQYFSSDLQDDPEIVAAATNECPLALRYASPRLRNHSETVLTAVTKNGEALEHASDELRNDPHVVMAAVKNVGCAIRHASEDVRDNDDVAIEAINQDPAASQYVSESLQKRNGFVALSVIAHRFGIPEEAVQLIKTNIIEPGKLQSKEVDKEKSKARDAKDYLDETRDTLTKVILSENNKMTIIDNLVALCKEAGVCKSKIVEAQTV